MAHDESRSPPYWLREPYKGNTNYYTAAMPQEKGLQREIDRFLEEVVGPEQENLELVSRTVAQRLGRRRHSKK